MLLARVAPYDALWRFSWKPRIYYAEQLQNCYLIALKDKTIDW